MPAMVKVGRMLRMSALGRLLALQPITVLTVCLREATTSRGHDDLPWPPGVYQLPPDDIAILYFILGIIKK